MDSHLSQHKPPKCLKQAEGQSRQVLARCARIRQPLLPPPGRKTQRGLQPRGILQIQNRPELDQPSRGDNRKLPSRGPLRANPRRSAHRNPRVALGRTAPRLKLIDGPAAATYRCEREPTYLRAVALTYGGKAVSAKTESAQLLSRNHGYRLVVTQESRQGLNVRNQAVNVQT